MRRVNSKGIKLVSWQKDTHNKQESITPKFSHMWYAGTLFD